MVTPTRATGQQAARASGKTGVLFVCLGNICRSPAAEAVFKAVLTREGLAGCFDVDSCGTGGGNPDWYKPGGWSYHEGDHADSRMGAAAARRKIVVDSCSRPLRPSDFARFDHIIGMDPKNIRAILTAADYWRSHGSIEVPPLEELRKRVTLMTEYCSDEFKGATEIPDPYYGGPMGFETVLDLLEDACVGLLASIHADQNGTGAAADAAPASAAAVDMEGAV